MVRADLGSQSIEGASSVMVGDGLVKVANELVKGEEILDDSEGGRDGRLSVELMVVNGLDVEGDGAVGVDELDKAVGDGESVECCHGRVGEQGRV